MKKKSNPTTPLPADTRTVPLHQEIATQAYILWQHYGQPHGRDLGIWLEAERQVLGADSQVNRQGAGDVDAQSFSSALAADSRPPMPAAGSLARQSYR